ncbi:MAG: hypothetical protein GEV03_10240 [Streptosporangiales bacterium]|nr:hypothetical protein [Streptosporangiales bacterium]
MSAVRMLTRAVLPVVLVLAAGCAAVPTGGPVLSGQAAKGEDPLGDPYIRVIPAQPHPGWPPEQIVRGFLAASASFAEDHAVARKYLAPDTATRWGSDRSVTVYDDGEGFSLFSSYASPSAATVTIAASEVATIDEQGQYVTASQGDEVHLTFELRKVDGQWRITELPEGLLLTQRDVARAYRVLNLYYLEPGYETLVPDPVFVPVQSRANLPTALVRALLRGPTRWLDPAVRTAFPADTRLVDDVQVAAGTVTVNLDRRAERVRGEMLSALSAQLVWTLKQLPDMQLLRLQIDGQTVEVTGSTGEEALQSRNDWARYRPDGLTGDVPTYFVRDGALWTLDGRGARRAPGAAGSGQVALHNPAVSLDGQRVAGLDSLNRVVVGELDEDGTLGPALFGGREFTALSWDRYGNLWAAEKRDKGARIWLLGSDGREFEVQAPGLEGEAVQDLQVARDGSRVAVVVGDDKASRLLIGRVVRVGETVSAESFLPLATDLELVTDVAWRDADRLVVLGRGNRGAILPYLVDVDGTQTSPTGSVGGMESIAAAPGSPTLAGIQDGQVWRSADELSWQVVGRGSDPAYPG